MRARDVPIPARMKHLPRDPRGYPEFFMIARTADGKAHFSVNEETKRQRCITEELCSICGGKLNRGRWFTGGPLSAFHAHGAYLDPPMHAECLHYALLVCPYLAMSRYAGLVEGGTIRADEKDRMMVTIDPAVQDTRPEVFVAVMATGQRLIKGELGTVGLMVPFVQYVKPARPYSRVEFWRHGERIDYATALTLMPDEHLQALGEYIAKHGPISRKAVAA